MKRYFVATSSAEGVKTNQSQFATIDEALLSARALLQREGAPTVWIIDDDGNLILPPDQIRLRLNAQSAASPRSS